MTRPVQILKRHPNLQSAPQPKMIYDGPEVPTAFDPNWQYFTNLTPNQIAWFQAQPEWNSFVASYNGWLNAANSLLSVNPGPSPSMTVTGANNLRIKPNV